MEVGTDKDYCSALGGLFQTIVNDLRGSSAIWEEFTNRAAKLHSSLKSTLVAISGFLEGFQKVADMATGSRDLNGATKDIGSALTRLCMRHRNIEAKLKLLTNSIFDSLVIPLQDRTEDWKKTVAHLDKEHAKEYKKARQEIKKAAADTMRIQKKIILYLKENLYQQHSPPSSPSSLGSRKSSMCSISSINSSSSGSSKSHSPGHKKASAQFVLQYDNEAGLDKLFLYIVDGENTAEVDNADADSTSSTPSDSTPSASSTWTNWPNPPNTGTKDDSARPHTISSAYEKAHARIPLTAQLFKPPIHDLIETKEEEVVQRRVVKHEKSKSVSDADPYPRPVSATINKLQPVLPPLAPKPKPKAVPPPKVPSTGEQPTYVNLNDLANMEAERHRDREQSTDSDQTPTEKSPPSGITTEIKQNSLELAEAIKELEASTAALQSTYDSPILCVNSLFADYDFCSTEYSSQHEKYFTIPRNSEIGNAYRAVFQAKRPASTAGLPVSQTGVHITRRSSMNTPKPPPPVRRSSSISTAAPAVVQKLRRTPPRQIPEGSVQHSSHRNSGNHRRSSSSGGIPEPAYAELQTIQQSIYARREQAGGNYVSSAPPTPSQYAVPGMTIHTQQQINSQPVSQAMSHVGGTQDSNSRFTVSASLQSSGHPPPPPAAVDPDLPPPPTDEELQEIEKVYSRPPPVNPKPSSTSGGSNTSGDKLRVSLISELKQGPKLRRVSSNDDSEC
ncbi:hypothetical protein KUTeg_019904 [Tegillarca granosa]|uniref:IMD domain-containing protein n=1 Tax=Tegillarca granosa TaxID=220873 RepID=A0ABQ9EJU6_TEGGR|nr:hypothetical protein KUTeg_019904 [Tegillarca granosa]